ncbi:uncharacterized protein LOC119770155 [Culex quinquefasciatus]|uniref:uncharacterized protein LOC119770155 n=1 Tax=Culex quinquefasciatus TaxID=7176 RepID=UPI0018E2EF44|nr:uncharacterized protein LOC119770155 [Culex quinquefasciatus]
MGKCSRIWVVCFVFYTVLPTKFTAAEEPAPQWTTPLDVTWPRPDQAVANFILRRSSARQKRQFGGFDFSSANANANAFSQGFGPDGFGASAANAQAQSFQSGGPLGSFGASAANAASQGFNVGPGGLSGSASFGGSQTYNFPGDRDLSISYSNGFAVGEDGMPTYSGGHALSWS